MTFGRHQNACRRLREEVRGMSGGYRVSDVPSTRQPGISHRAARLCLYICSAAACLVWEHTCRGPWRQAVWPHRKCLPTAAHIISSLLPSLLGLTAPSYEWYTQRRFSVCWKFWQWGTSKIETEAFLSRMQNKVVEWMPKSSTNQCIKNFHIMNVTTNSLLIIFISLVQMFSLIAIFKKETVC